MKKGKTASIAIIVGFIITIGMIIVMLYRTSGYTTENEYALLSIQVLDEERSEDGATCHVTGHFSRGIEDGKLLYFYPGNLEVRFWINDDLVYEFRKQEGNPLSTPGKTVAMLDLGTVRQTDTVRFELYDPWFTHSDGDVYDRFLNTFVIGNGQAIYQYLLKDKWIGMVVSLLLMFMGVVFLVYTCIYYVGHFQETEINFAYAWLSFSFGGYVLIQSLGNLLPLLLPNPLWCSILEVTFLYLAVSAIVTYLYVAAVSPRSKKLQFIFVMLILVSLMIIFIRQTLGVADMFSYRELMVLVLFTLLGISLLVGVIELWNEDSFQTHRFFIGGIPTLLVVLFTGFLWKYHHVNILVLNGIAVFVALFALAIAIASDARVDQLNLAYVTKQMITKKEQLDQAFEYISESKQRAAKLLSEKEMLEAQNQVDIMTGLFNKTAMNRLVSNYLQNNSAEKVALIFVDLDHFKSLNDTLGHMQGDDAIRDAAKKLRVSFRRYDLVSRFGGDEFCVFLRSIDGADLMVKLSNLVETLRATYSNGVDTVSITGSVGCAYCQGEHVDYDTMIKLADQAVYEAKEGGRNRYIIKTFPE